MTLTFQPLFSWPLIALVAALAIASLMPGLLGRRRGSGLRLIAFLAALLALTGPILSQEDRVRRPTEVAIVVDRSPSQTNGNRTAQTDAVLSALKTELGRFPDLQPRIIETERDDRSLSPSTRIFSALADGLETVPGSEVGSVIIISDGQVHDIPDRLKPAGLDVPVHALITGSADEYDRRIEIVRAPRFGLVGKEQELVFRVLDDGPVPGPLSQVTIRINGEDQGTLDAPPGDDVTFMLTLPRAGENVVELATPEVPGEVTAINNRIVTLTEGIRDNLRVLLVSGEPHAGERAWRNLLKSDAAVDLVHFTILRPPEKQDGTPINELSLIAFPTQELFVEKIKDFDLIIFDRFQNRGILPILYYDNIAQYVQAGGALLLVSGPEHASQDSTALTPLSAVLPAAPTGQMIEGPFYPRLSDLGRKHPVTRDLQGSDSEPPRWGRWFRSVGVEQPSGMALMNGRDQAPVLVLNRVGEGRVAMLLSDQGWLWARGFEGGGPHVDLYRRIAHWLMKESALEEEALTARAIGHVIEITRQTIGEDPGPATLKSPSGVIQSVPLTLDTPGRYKARVETDETGLFEIRNGDLTALVHSGAVDAPEFRETVSSTARLQPVAEATGGVIARAIRDGAVVLPQILTVSAGARLDDSSRMLIRLTSDTELRGVASVPLFSGLLGLALFLAAIGAVWWREGR